MPAVRRDGDPQFSVPGFLAVKRDADGFAALENAAVVAIGAAPQGLQFALSLVGTPVFRVAAAYVVKLFGQVDDGHGRPAFFPASNPALYAASSARRICQTERSWKSRESLRRVSSVSMKRCSLAMAVNSWSVMAASCRSARRGGKGAGRLSRLRPVRRTGQACRWRRGRFLRRDNPALP